MLKKVVAAFSITALLFLTSAKTVSAQETISPEKRALVEELLVVTEADQLVNKILNNSLTQLEQQLPTLVGSSFNEIPELNQPQAQQQVREISGRILQRYTALMQPRLSEFTQTIREINFSLYAKYYTESELRDLIAFYRTPTGKKTIQVTPEFVAESNRQVNERLVPEMMKIMFEIIREEIKPGMNPGK